MNPFRKSTILVLCTALLFAACKKELTQPPADAASENPSAGMVTSAAKSSLTRIKTETLGALTHTYYYDVSGRQIADLKAVGDTFGKMIYPDASHVTYFLPVTNDTAYYSLNSQGLATITKTTNFLRSVVYNNKDQWETMDYRYADGHTEHYTSVFDKGNRIMSIKKTNNEAVGDTTHFTYYLDKTNVLNTDAWGISYRGKNSNNLVKHYDYKKNGVLYTFDHTYEFDRSGRVIKQTVDRSGFSPLVTTYTYY